MAVIPGRKHQCLCNFVIGECVVDVICDVLGWYVVVCWSDVWWYVGCFLMCWGDGRGCFEACDGLWGEVWWLQCKGCNRLM